MPLLAYSCSLNGRDFGTAREWRSHARNPNELRPGVDFDLNSGVHHHPEEYSGRDHHPVYVYLRHALPHRPRFHGDTLHPRHCAMNQTWSRRRKGGELSAPGRSKGLEYAGSTVQYTISQDFTDAGKVHAGRLCALARDFRGWPGKKRAFGDGDATSGEDADSGGYAAENEAKRRRVDLVNDHLSRVPNGGETVNTEITGLRKYIESDRVEQLAQKRGRERQEQDEVIWQKKVMQMVIEAAECRSQLMNFFMSSLEFNPTTGAIMARNRAGNVTDHGTAPQHSARLRQYLDRRGVPMFGTGLATHRITTPLGLRRSGGIALSTGLRSRKIF